VGRIDEQDGKVPFEQIENGLPVYASQDVAKKILEWEYGVEIERTRLLKHTEEQLHAASSDTASSHEGPCPQGAGVSHGQAALSASFTPGGHYHV
jgi:hypothetical protein